MILLTLGDGLVVLTLGAELLVRGSVSLAGILGISPLVVGLTLVGFGTSTPELVTSIEAAAVGSAGIAIGNVVGSNICNVLLILGLAALIRPVTATPAAFRRDGAVMVAATLLGLAVVLSGEVNRITGIGFAAALCAYVVFTYLQDRQTNEPAAVRHAEEAAMVRPLPGGLAVALGLTLAGLALTILGGKLLVDSAIVLARDLGVSETVIGVSIVAVGTSLPELATSAVAAWRGQSDVALGNIVGSNIFNILGVLGIAAIVAPLAVPSQVATVDVWVMLAATAALVGACLTGWRVCRLEGALMLAGYAAYLGYLGVVVA